MWIRIILACIILTLATATGQAQDWQQNDAIFNPSGIPSLSFSQPRFADLDDDDDLDLILGSVTTQLLYFSNTGSISAPVFQPGSDIFTPVPALDAEMGVCVDLDGDGDLDLVTGGYTGLHLFTNVGSSVSPAFERVAGFFASLVPGSFPVPTLGDLDNDGDQDLVVGLSEDGRLKFYRNSGSPFAAIFTEGESEIWFDVGLYAYPWLCDLDGDLDLDLVVGRDEPELQFYRNVGSPDAWQWQANHEVFTGTAATTYWNSPCVIDLTGDDLLDLVFGTAAGPLTYFVNTGSLSAPVWTINTDLFGGVIDVGGASSPFFHDFDGDGDLDLVSGSQLGDIKYYENTGTLLAPAWLADHTYFASIDHSIYAAITIGDVNDDGLPDAIAGDLSGQLFFHRNTGTGFAYDASVFMGIDVGGWSVPRLVDMDADLDLDLVVGNEAGTLDYWRNDGTPATPMWAAVADFFPGLDVGSNCSPTLGDYDNDGDLDLITGSLFQEVRYFENVAGAWLEDTAVLAGITVGQNAAPALGDLDADGDLDLTVGNYGGTFNYFENTGPLTATPDARPPAAGPFRLSAAPNPFNPTTSIHFSLAEPAYVTAAIFDVSGRLVRSLPGGYTAAGFHTVDWNGKDNHGARRGSGVYLCRVNAGGRAQTIKLVGIK